MERRGEMKSLDDQQKNRQNAMMNRWMRKLIPVLYNDSKVALRFLLRYTRDNPVGNPEIFAHTTMTWCYFAASQIAQSLVNNSAASLEHRASAMTLLVSRTLVYPRNTSIVDIEALKSLLKEEAKDNDERLEVARLARAVALSEKLWQGSNEYLGGAIANIYQGLDFQVPLALDSPAGIIEAADNCIRHLIRLYSRSSPRSYDDEDDNTGNPSASE